MIIWLDAHLSPPLAAWITATFSVEARAIRDFGLCDAQDSPIFQAARAAGAVVMTKDKDFVEMLERLGAPPKVLWITCGNTSNARRREILSLALPEAISRLESGENWVEIGEAL